MACVWNATISLWNALHVEEMSDTADRLLSRWTPPYLFPFCCLCVPTTGTHLADAINDAPKVNVMSALRHVMTIVLVIKIYVLNNRFKTKFFENGVRFGWTRASGRPIRI